KDNVVKLAVEKELDKVKVPRLTGLPVSRIKELFSSLALNFSETDKRYDSREPLGTILDQNPKLDTLVDPGSRVSLTVAAEGIEVPDVSRSLKVQDAVNAILANKLTIGAINQTVTGITQSWDRVINQEPKARTRVAPSSPVTLFVGVRQTRSHAV